MGSERVHVGSSVTNNPETRDAATPSEYLADDEFIQTKDPAVQALARELPGPFLTGFNDRMFQTHESWEDDPAERLFDYAELAFPRAQFDPEEVYATMTAVAAGEVDAYRNLVPKSMIEETKSLIDAPWHKRTTDELGTRPEQIQHSFDMEPETPVGK
jgi:hypothetical protein